MKFAGENGELISMDDKTFTEWMNDNWQKDNMLPPPMDAQIAVNFLEQYLLGPDWYIVNPLTTAQANVEIVHEILYKYSKKYRKEHKQYKKLMTKNNKNK